MLDRRRFETSAYIGVIIAIVLGLYFSSRYSYLLFHSLVEITTVAIGFTLFILAWNARRFLDNDYLKVLGIGYAFVAVIDLVHTLAYKGMSVFPGFDANLPTQLWIAARYLQAATLCAAPLFATRRIGETALVVVYAAAISALLWLVYSGHFPDCYVEGKGLTPFKIASEYVITAMLMASLFFLHAIRGGIDRRVFALVAGSIVCTAVSELSFTAYLSVYGFANMLGHLMKLAAFYLIYRALLVTGFKAPFDLIFRDLTQARNALQKARDGLEEEVWRRTAQLHASEEKYRRIVDTAAEGIWAIGPDEMTDFVNARMAEMLGYTRDEMMGRPLTDFMPEEDVEDHRLRLAASRRGEAESYERRFRRKDGQTLWTLASATPILDADGGFKGAFAMFTDITARKLADATIRQLNAELTATLLAIPDLLFDLGRDGTYRNIWAQNPALLAREKEILLGHTVSEMLPPDAAETVMAAIAEADESNCSYGKVIRLDLAGGPSWFELSVAKKTDGEGNGSGFIVLSRDITERRTAEVALRRLNRELSAISNCNQALMRAEDEQTLLDTVCRIVCDEAGYRMAWVGYAEHDEARRVRVVAVGGVDDGYLATADITWADTERGRGPSGLAIRTGKPASIEDFAADANAGPWRENALRRGYRSSIALPLKNRSETFGVLCIYSAEPGAFTAKEVRLLEELAGDLAFGIVVLRARNDLKQAEREHLAHLNFLESMDRINRAMRGTNDLDQMMRDVLDVVLSIFGCDRAYLLYPCDPEASAWQVPMERNKPEYPGALARGQTVPMDEEVAATLRILRNAEGPVTFGPGTAHPLPADVSERFGIRSYMATVLYPRVGKPWQFGIHACAAPRAWTPEEQRLLEEIGRHLADGLSTLLAYRDLQESERKLAEAEHMVHVGYWDIDLTDRHVSFSDELYRIYGLPPEEPISDLAAWQEIRQRLIHPEDSARAVQAFADALRDGTPYDAEYRVLMPDGNVRVIHSRGTPTRDESGRLRRMLGTAQDVTERKQAETQLRQLNETLEQRVREELARNREKDLLLIQQSRLAAMGEMVHNIAHQWRQPLMALGLYLANIKDSYDYGELTKEELDQTVAEGIKLVRQMSTTIDDFRDFFRPENELVDFPVSDSLHEVRGIIGAALAQQGIELDDRVSEQIVVRGYENEFGQVLLNIIDNAKEAITRRNPPSPRIRVSATARNGMVDVRISDNGGGIPRDVLPKIFDPYFTTKEKGTGIGLYMSKMIIEGNMGGEIVARNVEDGVEVSIRVPAAKG